MSFTASKTINQDAMKNDWDMKKERLPAAVKKNLHLGWDAVL